MDWYNMRDNVRAYLYGDIDKMPEGEWGIYRWFDRSQPLTSNWSPTYDESVGGTKHKYRHYMIRMLKRPIGDTYGQPMLEDVVQGITDKEGFIAMIAWDLSKGTNYPIPHPQIGDIILSLEGVSQIKKPSPPYRFSKQYEVKTVLRSAGDFGRPEGWIIHIKNAPHVR